jgi:hypothetical protein
VVRPSWADRPSVRRFIRTVVGVGKPVELSRQIEGPPLTAE